MDKLIKILDIKVNINNLSKMNIETLLQLNVIDLDFSKELKQIIEIPHLRLTGINKLKKHLDNLDIESILTSKNTDDSIDYEQDLISRRNEIVNIIKDKTLPFLKDTIKDPIDVVYLTKLIKDANMSIPVNISLSNLNVCDEELKYISNLDTFIDDVSMLSDETRERAITQYINFINRNIPTYTLEDNYITTTLDNLVLILTKESNIPNNKAFNNKHNKLIEKHNDLSIKIIKRLYKNNTLDTQLLRLLSVSKTRLEDMYELSYNTNLLNFEKITDLLTKIDMLKDRMDKRILL